MTFKFVKYEFSEKTGVLKMDYALGDLRFSEKLIFPKPFKKLDDNKKKALDRALFNVFLIAGVSYYKIYCPRKIDLGEYKLTKEQAKFWDKLYTKGLGEFFYINKIDFRGLVKFPCDKNYKEKGIRIKASNKSLVPVGGGKDSIVAIEMLKVKKEKFDLFSLRKFKVIEEVAKVAGKKLMVIDRKLDQEFFNLNKKKNIYKGHIPFSAYLAFLMTVMAILYDYKKMVASHEKSANFGNVKYLGDIVNHQYAKSLEFEKDFQKYLKQYISPSLEYYSLLRDMSELEIMGRFVKYKKYFNKFSSCNLANFRFTGATKQRWCGKCAKCVFTWTMLAAYLEKQELIKIFGRDISSDKQFKLFLQELLGKDKNKPFECVGTPDETRKAMEMANKKILILGFGREGLSSYRYLRKQNKNQIIAIADVKKIDELGKKYRDILKKDKNLELHLGKSYLKNLDKYNTIIKTPGLKLKNKNISTISNLDIFLGEVQGKVIGVTGSKGKSTSASLIYEILKKAGKKTVLMGNIGKPALDYSNQDSRDTVYIIEMSSYQLDTLDQKKIDIALVTSFFPEHLDYHGGLDKYFQAKMNIIKNLKNNGRVVYNGKYKELKNYINGIEYSGIYKGKTRLLGRHNLENILGCIKVVKLFKVRDNIIKKVIASFKGLPHRMEYIGKFKGVNFYNDVLSTTPESTIAAIDALKDKELETIIVGGYDRGLDYKKLARKIIKAKIKNVICWPNSGEKIYKEIKKIKSKFRPNLIKVKNMKETVRAAYKYTNKNATILLSPASSSYDFYDNFQEKGEEFKAFLH